MHVCHGYNAPVNRTGAIAKSKSSSCSQPLDRVEMWVLWALTFMMMSERSSAIPLRPGSMTSSMIKPQFRVHLIDHHPGGSRFSGNYRIIGVGDDDLPCQAKEGGLPAIDSRIGVVDPTPLRVRGCGRLQP